jgi:predicted  nucleic acid-binding Zn-ribbon protein
MADISDLLALQDTDLALDRARARLAEIEESLAEPEDLIEAKAAVTEKSAVAHDIKVQQKDAELAIDDIRAKAAEIEKKLYSGQVKNPKELEDLDLDLKSLRENIRRHEDDLLTILEAAEEADAELNAVREHCEQLESAWNATRESMLAERADIEPDVERLESVRDEQATDFERTVMNLYQLLRERRGGTAVARVERGMCQGCRITLPVSVLQRARSSNGVVQCVSCERILVPT